MESKVNYTFVGAFVIGLITALIFIGVWLSTQWKGKVYNIYAAYMAESVSGLAINAPVKYSGVKVGYVDSITLDPQNPQHVRLLMKIENTAPITEATTAKLTEQGLTGVSSIDLHANTNNARPLMAKPGELYPVIKTAPSLFTRLDTAISQLIVRLDKGADALNQTFDPHTQELLRHSIKNIDNITTTLSANMKTFDQSMAHVQIFIKKGEVATDQLNVGLKAFSTQTLPQINQLLGNLTMVSSQLSEVSDQLVQNPSILIKGRTPPAKGPGE
jgi:phospholipid/cholesterol/gamma-HCH transport system substrate-binding protein